MGTIEQELTRQPTLALYRHGAPLRILVDASSYGLGEVLEQHQEKPWKPIICASRSLSETETKYAQIETEALAATWACEKFKEYILDSHRPKTAGETTCILNHCRPSSQTSEITDAVDMLLLHHSVRARQRIPHTRCSFLGSDRESKQRRGGDPGRRIVHSQHHSGNTIFDKCLAEIKEAQDKDLACQKLKKHIGHESWYKDSIYWSVRGQLTCNKVLIMKKTNFDSGTATSTNVEKDK
ncbi:hypothetical protein PR048_018220 [Dryococelus australis]|uniref:Reverse transcriptase/retrotransposon-derived protein RNase H-like domain-containing protein n=1 Tax=Dryococelus australis TaxID=614101 RepID=A0ABQ9HBT7_9NEOP|nr:hypothetical protein PR048_018220 [Dryococelus australis]